tara:strand:+ start:209 stop:652 length:444 start_codon:yes stop_codon:yes gene_type:complete
MVGFNIWNNYGGIVTVSNTTAETTVDNTPREIASWTANMPSSSTCTPDYTSNHIAITNAGDYLVNAQFSFSGTNSSTYIVAIYLGGVITNLKTERKLGAGGDVGSASISGILTIPDASSISLYQSTTDGSIMTVTEAQLSLTRIGWQ